MSRGDTAGPMRPRLVPFLLMMLLAVLSATAVSGETNNGTWGTGGSYSDKYDPAAEADEYGNDKPEVIAYKYVIVVGFIAVVAALVPLHALLSPKGRLLWHSMALFATLVSATGAIVGATFKSGRVDQGGYMWRTIPTAVFMVSLALLIQVRVLGGWHVLQRRARSRGRVILATVSDRQWREDIGLEEYSRLIAQSGLGSNILRFSSEPDQDAAVVAILPTMKTWAFASAPGASGGLDGTAGGDEIVCSDAEPHVRLHPRHEPGGLVLLGSVRYADIWLEDLLNAIRRQPRGTLAMLHHVCVLLWLVGMILGALSKTGYNAPSSGEVALSPGVKRLREVGMWVQAVLLVVAIYGFPYTRGISRYGTRVLPRAALLFAQTFVSFGIGIAMVAVIKENRPNQNLIAFAVALSICSIACAVWCLISVSAYQQAITVLLARNPLRNQKAMAFITAIVTRPRHGYRGNIPVMCWGDRDNKGHAALEVLLEHEVDLPSDEVISERVLDNAANAEWNMLESAARSKF